MPKKPITEGYDKRTIKPKPTTKPASPPPAQRPSSGSGGGKSDKK